MLCDEEWVLLNELCTLFKPFDEVTTYFSGVNYATISSILPIIQVLKFIYKKKLKEGYNIDDKDLIDDSNYDDTGKYYFVLN